MEGADPSPNLTGCRTSLKVFNDQFGNIPWTDAARIEHDKSLARVMTAVLKDDTELFKQFTDNDGFRRWLTDTVFGIMYDRPSA